MVDETLIRCCVVQSLSRQRASTTQHSMDVSQRHAKRTTSQPSQTRRSRDLVLRIHQWDALPGCPPPHALHQQLVHTRACRICLASRHNTKGSECVTRLGAISFVKATRAVLCGRCRVIATLVHCTTSVITVQSEHGRAQSAEHMVDHTNTGISIYTATLA